MRYSQLVSNKGSRFSEVKVNFFGEIETKRFIVKMLSVQNKPLLTGLNRPFRGVVDISLVLGPSSAIDVNQTRMSPDFVSQLQLRQQAPNHL